MNATQQYAVGGPQDPMSYGYSGYPMPIAGAPVQNAPVQGTAVSPEKKAEMKKKIKKAHRKAKFAGALYLLGSILLFAFLFVSSEAILAQTFFKVGDWNVGVTNFYKPLLSFEAKLRENGILE